MDHSGDHSRRSAPPNQPRLPQPLQTLRYAYSERSHQHTPNPYRRVGSLERPESLDAPIISQSTHQAKARIATGELRARDGLNATVVSPRYAAPKIAANNRSPCDNARPQPRAASTVSAKSSRRRGSINGSFISHLI